MNLLRVLILVFTMFVIYIFYPRKAHVHANSLYLLKLGFPKLDIIYPSFIVFTQTIIDHEPVYFSFNRYQQCDTSGSNANCKQ